MFVKLVPGGIYNWTVTVDGITSKSWSFTAEDRVYPLNDRSVDVTIADSTYLPQQFQNMLVSKNHRSFLKFDIPSNIDSTYKINLNLTPGKIYKEQDGFVIYRFPTKDWDERLKGTNIGLVDKSYVVSIDTLRNLKENEPISIDVRSIIDTAGVYSFALGGISEEDSMYLYSRDKLLLNGDFNNSIENHNSGYAALHSVWPSISFKNDAKLNVVDDLNLQIPSEFALHDNYPNPFNPTTVIRFDIPTETKVRLVVYNMLGQKVKTLEQSTLSPGYHSIVWNGTNDQGLRVSAGMYFYQVQTNEFVKTKKMVLLK